MYAPVFWPPQSPISPEVRAEEEAIVRAQGYLTVEGRYFACDSDAQQQRRLVAERHVREATRRPDDLNGAHCTELSATPFLVTTWITPRERQRVDSGAIEQVKLVHRESLADAGCDLARGAADGMLLSAARLAPDYLPAAAALVRGFPANVVVGLVGDLGEREAVAASLRLGQVGVRALVDLRTPDGWRDFRAAFQPDRHPDQFIRRALVTILGEIGEADSCEREGRNEFFRLAFSRHITSVKVLASSLGVHPSTLLSRFYRAGLPSPKQYVAYARLVWAAHLGESTGMSIAAIAHRLSASSPQSFHRTVRTFMGTSAANFRRSLSGAAMLDCYRARLVTPYRERLRTFIPLVELSTAVRAARNTDGSRYTDRAEQGRAA